MEKIGTGLNKLWFAPAKSGLYWPSAPIMTVQLPDTGGSNGSSKGGAGKVNAVWADAPSKTAAVALRAASVAAKKVRCAPLVEKRGAASMACFIKGPLTAGLFVRASWCGFEPAPNRWPTLPQDCRPQLPTMTQSSG